MEKNTDKYTRFELMKYYISLYKLYRYQRKCDKYNIKMKKYTHKHQVLRIALQAGNFSSKEFCDRLRAINVAVDAMKSDRNRLQELAGIIKQPDALNKTAMKKLKNEMPGRDIGASALVSNWSEKE